MNLCFVIGKVVTDTEFNFLCDKKYTSIAKCNIELSNKSVIEVFGYNEIADYLYSKIKNLSYASHRRICSLTTKSMLNFFN